MTYIKRWLEGGAVTLLSVALVCVSTATFPDVAEAEIGAPCFADIDCDSGERCNLYTDLCEHAGPCTTREQWGIVGLGLLGGFVGLIPGAQLAGFSIGIGAALAGIDCINRS